MMMKILLEGLIASKNNKKGRISYSLTGFLELKKGDFLLKSGFLSTKGSRELKIRHW